MRPLEREKTTEVLRYERKTLSLHKISCTREAANKLAFRSFALSLQKISIIGRDCGRKSKDRSSCLSVR